MMNGNTIRWWVFTSFIVTLQTIPFTSDAENERKLLRELKVNVDAANCPYIVQFFGAFYIDVRHFWIIINIIKLLLSKLYRKSKIRIHCCQLSIHGLVFGAFYIDACYFDIVVSSSTLRKPIQFLKHADEFLWFFSWALRQDMSSSAKS